MHKHIHGICLQMCRFRHIAGEFDGSDNDYDDHNNEYDNNESRDCGLQHWARNPQPDLANVKEEKVCARYTNTKPLCNELKCLCFFLHHSSAGRL